MFPTFLFSPLAKAAGAFLLGAAVLGGVYIKGRHDGREALLGRLAAERITILKDGRRIDDEVLRADDSALCGLLGGCLPDEAGPD